jgi:plastocyanin
MRRILIGAVVAAATVIPAGAASAGGYCAEGPFVDQAGDTVVMKQFCFAPTVLRVDPATTVTFVNRDVGGHTAGGVAGAFGDPHADVAPGARVTHVFDEEGIFPYYCVYHPGMVGAIVVGEGGPAEVTAAGKPASGAGTVEVAERPAEAGSAAPIAAAAAGLAAGGGLFGLVALRRRRNAGPA